MIRPRLPQQAPAAPARQPAAAGAGAGQLPGAGLAPQAPVGVQQAAVPGLVPAPAALQPGGGVQQAGAGPFQQPPAVQPAGGVAQQAAAGLGGAAQQAAAVQQPVGGVQQPALIPGGVGQQAAAGLQPGQQGVPGVQETVRQLREELDRMAAVRALERVDEAKLLVLEEARTPPPLFSAAKVLAALNSLEERAKVVNHVNLPTFTATVNEARVFYFHPALGKMVQRALGPREDEAVAKKFNAVASASNSQSFAQLQPPVAPQLQPPVAPQLQPPVVSQFQHPGVSQFQTPAVPQFQHPGVPQFQSPAVPQFHHPGVPQFQSPAVPQFQPSGVPQFQPPVFPQFQPPAFPHFQPPAPTAPFLAGGSSGDWEGRCFLCGGEGHYKSRCPSNKGVRAPAQRPSPWGRGRGRGFGPR
ncbi:periaxin-like [Branchiostoma floridae]|uniref:Periaxin-like n=1 Tax=Branchiostoma floridae TaxID=7739 RepID=A0A9J7LN49_BRAFL|nr:periaxin-like [Branchiostoma floridae]